MGCEPYYRDWSEGACVSDVCVGGLLDGQRWPCTFDDECRRVDVIDAGIIPEGVYEVRIIDITCSVGVPEAYSDPLVVTMSESGDIVGHYDDDAGWWTAPNGVVDFNDISACVDKFKNEPTAPRKARCDVTHADVFNPLPDKKVDFVDISCIVAAFRGTPCPLTGPPVIDPCD